MGCLPYFFPLILFSFDTELLILVMYVLWNEIFTWDLETWQGRKLGVTSILKGLMDTLGSKLGNIKCVDRELIRWCCVEGHILKMLSFSLSCIIMLLLIVLTKCKTKTWTFVKIYIKNNWYSKVILPLLSVIQKPKSNLEVDREQERCS